MVARGWWILSGFKEADFHQLVTNQVESIRFSTFETTSAMKQPSLGDPKGCSDRSWWGSAAPLQSETTNSILGLCPSLLAFPTGKLPQQPRESCGRLEMVGSS